MAKQKSSAHHEEEHHKYLGFRPDDKHEKLFREIQDSMKSKLIAAGFKDEDFTKKIDNTFVFFRLIEYFHEKELEPEKKEKKEEGRA